MAFNYDEYLNFVVPRESGGNPNAKNPNSSASGLFQFIDSTYLPYAQRVMPGVSESALMAKKNDPQMQNAVMRAFTEDNANALQKSGIDPNNGTAYLAHFLGAGGAIKALLADPNTPIQNVVNSDAIRANPNVFANVRTAGDLKAWAETGKPMQGSVARNAAADTADYANMPIAGGAEAQFSVPGAPEPSTWDKVMAGGPGALFGMPQKGWNVGDALTGAGIALMSRDNPAGAAALAKYMGVTKRDDDNSANLDVKYDEKAGKAMIFNKRTGQMQVRSFANPKPGEKAEGEFKEVHNKLGTLANVTDEANEMRQLIATGQLDLTLANQGAAKVRQLFGAGSPQDALYTRFDAFKENLRNAQLVLQKGVQTEGDAVRAMNQYFPGMSTFDNVSTLTALDRIIEGSKKDTLRWTGMNKAFLDRHKDYDTTGSYSESLGKYSTKYDEVEKDFAPKRDQFLRSRAPKSDPAVTGARPVQGSLPQPDKDGIITAPNGVRIKQIQVR